MNHSVNVTYFRILEGILMHTAIAQLIGYFFIIIVAHLEGFRHVKLWRDDVFSWREAPARDKFPKQGVGEGVGADLGALSTNHSQQGLECQGQSQSWKFQGERAEVTVRSGSSEGEGRCARSCTGIPQQLQLFSPYCVILKLGSYIPFPPPPPPPIWGTEEIHWMQSSLEET